MMHIDEIGISIISFLDESGRPYGCTGMFDSIEDDFAMGTSIEIDPATHLTDFSDQTMYAKRISFDSSNNIIVQYAIMDLVDDITSVTTYVDTRVNFYKNPVIVAKLRADRYETMFLRYR